MDGIFIVKEFLEYKGHLFFHKLTKYSAYVIVILLLHRYVHIYCCTINWISNRLLENFVTQLASVDFNVTISAKNLVIVIRQNKTYILIDFTV